MDVPNAQRQLLPKNDEAVQYLKNLYNCTDDKVANEKLDAIETWMRGEGHLAEASKHISRSYLWSLFLLSKCSTEATKLKIDKILTLKTLMPELFNVKELSDFDRLFKTATYILMPKICPTDYTRISIMRFHNANLEYFDFMTFCRYCVLLAEYRAEYDSTTCETIIVDICKINVMNLLTKISPVVLKKIDLISATFGIKIKGIHIISTSIYVEKLVALVKQAMREKVASRLFVHSSYDPVFNYIPKDVMPKDLGGKDLSSDTIREQWQNELRTEEAGKFMEKLRKIVSDESKRSSFKFNEEYMGMPGSFRKLNVD